MALAGAAAHAAPALTGFDQVATGEVVEIRKPMWQSGKLSLGKAVGRVERRALGRSRTQGAAGVDHAEIERFGRTRFHVTGAEVGGTLSGECRYDRLEQRLSAGAVSATAAAAPLSMACDFARDGRPIGRMRLDGRFEPLKLAQITRRDGEVEINGTRLALRSEHRLGGRGIPTPGPVGYWIEGQSGEKLGAVDTNGVTRVRLALPKDPAQRDAAMAAGLALAVFWDPGDTDD
jgi:hypothetical protein